MRRAMTLGTAGLLLALTPAIGQAAPRPKAPRKTTRVVSFSYTMPCGVHASGVGSLNGSVACDGKGHTSVQATKDEKYMTFEATDTDGTPVGVQMWVNNVYSGGVAYFCAKGKGAYKKGGGKFDFTISLAPAGCQGVPTTGTLKITLSNLP